MRCKDSWILIYKNYDNWYIAQTLILDKIIVCVCVFEIMSY